MAGTFQAFLVNAIPQAAKDLETALLRLPEDKRNWSPTENARSAMNMIAECAILGDPTGIVKSRSFPTDFDMAAFHARRNELATDWETCRELLHANVDRAIATIREIPDSDLDQTVQMPWGPFTLAQIVSYPYWNMSYHEGQINYIASMLGCLD